MKVQVGADGSVLEAFPDPDSPQPAQVLQDSAVAGVKQWSFNAARNAGATVDTWVRVPVSFRLDGNSASVQGSNRLDPIQVTPAQQQSN